MCWYRPTAGNGVSRAHHMTLLTVMSQCLTLFLPRESRLIDGGKPLLMGWPQYLASVSSWGTTSQRVASGVAWLYVAPEARDPGGPFLYCWMTWGIHLGLEVPNGRCVSVQPAELYSSASCHFLSLPGAMGSVHNQLFPSRYLPSHLPPTLSVQMLPMGWKLRNLQLFTKWFLYVTGSS